MAFWVRESKTPNNAWSQPSVSISGPFATYEEAAALAQRLRKRGVWDIDGEVIESDTQPDRDDRSISRPHHVVRG
ncbi:MAG: hypothetical protein LC793_12130 [Thermomicrobia bacterium]|nr:hypothetical protein [Thermomicrobia bacterium]